MDEPDPKDAFGYVNGTLHTTPELTAEESAQEDDNVTILSGREEAA